MRIGISTSKKVRIAGWLSRALIRLRALFGRSSEARVSRGGVNWRLDLREGLDLSIYLLGGFEPGTLKCYSGLVRRGGTVLDIGANIGAHTLPLARLVGPAGKVVAFEPAKYAFGKLLTNIALNPELAGRIVPRQTYLAEDERGGLPEAVYASWPMASSRELHPGHKGRLMPTGGASRSTLDGELAELGVSGADFIKLDVDGAELAVLEGAKKTLSHRPPILVELAPYVYEDRPGQFDSLVALLVGYGYALKHADTMRPLPADPRALRGYIPAGGSINALCLPPSIPPRAPGFSIRLF